MITGVVNAALEARIQLNVLDGSGSPFRIEAVLDSGFSDFLTRPTAVIAALGLLWVSCESLILADGSVRQFDLYEASVVWDGQVRIVEVEEAAAPPLLGMSMLMGHEVRIEVVGGGAVEITPIP